jgi:hypothetical protein
MIQQTSEQTLRIGLFVILLVIGWMISTRWLNGSNRRGNTYTIPTFVLVFLYIIVAIALWRVSHNMNVEAFHVEGRTPREVTILYTDRYSHTAFEAKSLLERLSIPSAVRKSCANEVIVATNCGLEFRMSQDEILDTESDFTTQNIKYFVMKAVNPPEGAEPIPVRTPIWPVMRRCSSN